MDAQVICCFDGKLIDDGSSCKYIGGCKKLNMVPKTIGYTCFKEKIQQMMKSPSNEIDFKIKCGVRFDDTLVAIDVDDDESLGQVMNTSKYIRAYVIKELPHTPTFVPTRREEDFLPSDANLQFQPLNSNYNHGDEGKHNIVQCTTRRCQYLNGKSLYEQKQFVSSQQKNNANVENNVEYPDLSTRLFTTDTVFETRSTDLIQWAKKYENATSDGTHRLYLSAFELKIPKFNSFQSAKPIEPPLKKLKVTKATTPPNKKMGVLKIPQSLGKGSIEKFPDFFRPFIINANNVDGDGNCGFRAVAVGMEMDNERGWLKVRTDLTDELLCFREEYNKVFGGKEQVNTLLDILDTDDSPCPPKNWFLLPYMGYLVASRYHHVLVSISLEASLTFVPLRSVPPSKKQNVLAIGLIDGNHFVPLKLKAGCPIPEPVALWKKFHHREADKWEQLLQRRNRAFKEIVGDKIQTQEGSYDQPIILE